ncbi:hypothetical protein D4R75_10530 [bacterium]|nr:MAG: hypothetical protein D4R75_10530 [bacterium]
MDFLFPIANQKSTIDNRKWTHYSPPVALQVAPDAPHPLRDVARRATVDFLFPIANQKSTIDNRKWTLYSPPVAFQAARFQGFLARGRNQWAEYSLATFRNLRTLRRFAWNPPRPSEGF